MRRRCGLLLFTFLALSSCYEGSGRSSSGSGGGAGGQGGGGGKSYGVVLVDVFRPSSDLLSNVNCSGVPSSLHDLRMAEMDTRVKAITTQLDAQSDNLRVNVSEIANCGDFSAIESRAINPLPDPTVADAEKAKPALHIRMVLWFANGNDHGSNPTPMVTTNEWADMQRLATLGYDHRLSANHFATLGTGSGYLPSWQMFSDRGFNSFATVLDGFVPNDAGIQKDMDSVKQGIASFSDWLTQKAKGL
jgi:hypothetical protein